MIEEGQVIEVKIEDIKYLLGYTSESRERKLNDDEYIRKMADRINYLPPILLTLDLFLLDGSCRIEAHKLAERSVINAQLVDTTGWTNSDIIVFMLEQNAVRGGKYGMYDSKRYVLFLYDNAITKKEISEITGVSARTISRWLKPIDIQRKQEVEYLVWYLHDNFSLSNREIGRQVGISHNKVKRILDKGLSQQETTA